MKLRKLKEKDAPLMLEWMHDENVLIGLQRDKFINKTIDDCLNFIENSKMDINNVNLAIVNDLDEYMGTVSLKNINKERLDAEFAIVIRSSAMGTGVSKYAMQEIINYAFCELGLKRVYWNVLETNKRAISLYNKLGYHINNNIDQEILDEHFDLLNGKNKFIWYSVNSSDNI